MPALSKLVGFVEIAVALLATYATAMSFYDIALNTQAAEWAPLLLIVTLPVAISFAVAGVILFTKLPNPWRYQSIPVVVIFGLTAFFFWID